MKKKSFVLVLGFALVLSLCTLAVAGCKRPVEPKHQHEWETTYRSDKYQHWYACLGCDKKKGVWSHQFVNDVCVCGRQSGMLLYTLEGDGYVLDGFNKDFWEDPDDIEDIDLVIPATYQGKPVKRIGKMAFWLKDYLKSVTIPDSVKSIGAMAFFGCKELTSVVIPNSVTSLGSSAFCACQNLTSVTIGSGVETLENIFHVLPDNYFFGSDEWKEWAEGILTSAGSGVFYWCDNLTSIQVDEENPYFKSENNCVLTKDGGTLIFGCKSSVIPNGVTDIHTRAFAGCDGLDTIDLPESILRIGAYAFAGSSLTGIEIPNSIDKVSQNAFEGCRKLENVVISDGVTKIEDSAFNKCHQLKSIALPDSVTSIGYAAFCDTGLESIEIPLSVSKIGFAAFASCENLVSIQVDAWNPYYKSENNCLLTRNGKTLLLGCSTSVIPNGVTKIEDSAFRFCVALKNINIPNSVTSIGDGAFLHCQALTQIEIPNSVTEIGDEAFYDCKGLKSLELPDSVKSVGINAFRGCSGIKSVRLSKGLTCISEGAFRGCSNLTSIKIPESVTEIGKSAFDGCSGLTTVTIPNNVTEIGESAFDGCSGLTRVVLSENLKSIGKRAFYLCDLAEIAYGGTMAQWNAIDKGSYWDTGTGKYKVCCTDGTLFE